MKTIENTHSEKLEKAEIDIISAELLAVHVTLEKLKLARKSILRDALILGVIAIILMLVGAYGSIARWTNFPIFPATIFAGGILLAIAFRPLQQYKNELASAEETRNELQTILKNNHLDYKVDVRVTRDSEGEYVIKKSIKLVTIK
ncbi:hypothetical protein IMCC3317_03110 [Kordia antarctica]|uniref:Uncharacterized protein n=2 Tax=Kordia antarctica TaxID=1218801 RepID=A0A7L4ZE96_9FLAO|nr:hypothetical protein IMCC3317_03110 [Kordia antarctica]